MKTVSDKFEFFPGQRRKVELVGWQQLLNSESEKRIRFDFLLPLTNQSLIGLPNFVAPAYESMEREASAIGDTDLTVELEGVTVQAYSTQDAKRAIAIDTLGMELTDEEAQLGHRHVLMTAATLRAFKVVRATRDGVAIVALKFSVTVRSDLGLVCFASTYHGATFWCSFTETQPTIPQLRPENERLDFEAPADKPNGKGSDAAPAEPAPADSEPAARRRGRPPKSVSKAVN